jgi:hypothetical protein
VTLSGNGDDTTALTRPDFRAPGRAPFDGVGSAFFGVFHRWHCTDHANNLAAKPTSGQRRINNSGKKEALRYGGADAGGGLWHGSAVRGSDCIIKSPSTEAFFRGITNGPYFLARNSYAAHGEIDNNAPIMMCRVRGDGIWPSYWDVGQRTRLKTFSF